MSKVTDDSEVKSKAELKAEMMIRRQRRNMRKSWAEGYLTGVCAMLKPDDLVIDCGANVGDITARLAQTGANVIGFEPDPGVFTTLQSRFADMANVTLINAAVGVGAGTVRLMRSDNFDANPVGASVKSTILQGARRIDTANSVEVPLIDFPGVILEKSEMGPVAFIKMDIEGAELDILEVMMRDKLFGHVRCLVAETHERKFPDLRPRFRDLRKAIAADDSLAHINLDWI